MLPIKRLHSNIQYAIKDALIVPGYIARNTVIDYIPVTIRADKHFQFFMKPAAGCSAFLIEVDLSEDVKEVKPTFPRPANPINLDVVVAAKKMKTPAAPKKYTLCLGTFEGQYQETKVDKDKSKKPLDKNKAIVRGYIKNDINGGRDHILENIEVIFHPSQAPYVPPEVLLNDRDRRILYCFGALKNNGLRREALSRLEVTDEEIRSLIDRGCLKMTGSGPIMTLTGEVNRLAAKPEPDQW